MGTHLQASLARNANAGAGAGPAALDVPLVVAEVGGDEVIVLEDGFGDLAGGACMGGAGS